MDEIRDCLASRGLAGQFHPSYTRMVPAHYLLEIALVGCPDPNPTYTRYFTPTRNALPADLDAIGRAYIGALADECQRWLDRIDAVYGHTFIGTRVPLERTPSDYFRERVWISCDPDERTIPALADRFGADRFLWASDFPHADHTPEYLKDLEELAAAFTDEDDRRRFLGDNARTLFDIGA